MHIRRLHNFKLRMEKVYDLNDKLKFVVSFTFIIRFFIFFFFPKNRTHDSYHLDSNCTVLASRYYLSVLLCSTFNEPRLTKREEKIIAYKGK